MNLTDIETAIAAVVTEINSLCKSGDFDRALAVGALGEKLVNIRQGMK